MTEDLRMVCHVCNTERSKTVPGLPRPHSLLGMQMINYLYLGGTTVVSFAAVIRVVTQGGALRDEPNNGGEERCVTTLITAAKETRTTAGIRKRYPEVATYHRFP